MIPKNNDEHWIVNNPNQNEINTLYDKYGDCDKFLLRLEDQIKEEVYRKKEQVFFERSPSLEILEEAYGTNFLLKVLSYQFIEINTCSNIKLKMDTEQIKDLARFFLYDFNSLKITELLLFIKGVKNAAWGNFYAQIDPHLIKSWFRHDFLTSKNEIIAEYRKNKRLAIEQEEKKQKQKEREETEKNRVTREQYLEMKAKGIPILYPKDYPNNKQTKHTQS